jgi:RNA polymerase sigma-70 factor (ECF subfamily)
MVNDLELVQKISTSDNEAFREFIKNHQEMVMNVCFHFLRNRQDAEDVAQDVFIKAFHSANEYRGDSKVSTWLYRIAVNQSLNFIRNKKRRRWLSLDFNNKNGEYLKNIEESPVKRPDTQFETNEMQSILMKAIHDLPENQKSVFILHKLDGLSYHEITKILNCSLSSVESRMHRAKVNLQKKLAKYYT